MFRPRFFFNADGAQNGGGDGQAADGDAGGTTATGGGTEISGQDGAGTQSGSDDQTFTQADLDRIAGKTRKEALAKFAKELGLDDPKDLEKIVKAKKEADDQARSDLEKANDAKTAAEKREQEAITKAKNALLRAAFDREGVSLVEDLDSAFVVAGSLGLLGDESGLEINLDTARVDGMDKVIKKLIDQKPLFKKGSQAQPVGTGGGERGTTVAAGQLSPEQEEAERRKRGIRPRRAAA